LDILLGVLFALLWSSASIAAKFGLHDAAPLTMLLIRFTVTGFILMIFVYGIRRSSQRPRGREWYKLVILALCNSTLYLGFAWLALRDISVGLFALFGASNPLLVALISRVWIKRKVSTQEWFGIILSTLGLIVATWPQLSTTQGSLGGIILGASSIVVYAIGSVYFKRAQVQLTGTVLNAWQISIGAVLILPFAILLNDNQPIQFTPTLIAALGWVIVGVSIVAVTIWFYLLKKDPLRASMWLFLNPVFGYLEAAVLLKEPIHSFDIVGTVLVVLGLVISGTFDFKHLPLIGRLRAPASLETIEPESGSAVR
jgi:drug/metabolite transporter (DMT)-like permease